ncbi:DNA gyrase subunit A, partial [Acetomicrobium sp. S15 = DSM 107314]|uniref:DNA gyrase subunit A n=1 Tax=Acetomicrobium sp. S15 = DSM 107314 TaxID=2529858 RepID=UPI001E5B80B7
MHFLRNGMNPFALQAIMGHSNLETTKHYIALVDAKPVVLPLLELLRVFVEHRRSVVRRRTAFRLKKAEERAHA